MKSIIPVVMAGIIAIYGVVVSVLIAGALKWKEYSIYKAWRQIVDGHIESQGFEKEPSSLTEELFSGKVPSFSTVKFLMKRN